MLKLAVFSGSDMRNFGGGEKYVIELIKRLKGFDTTIFSFVGTGKMRMTENEVAKIAGVPIIYYRTLHVPVAQERLMLTPDSFRHLDMLRGYDVVYNLDNSLVTNLLLTKYSRKYGFRYILGIHDANILRDAPIKKSVSRAVLLRFYKNIRNSGLMKAPAIRVINRRDGDKLRALGYKGRIYAITDFVNVKARQNDIKVNKKEFVALFVGRLSITHKGIDLLAEIVAKTVKLDPGVKFHIIGSGDDGEGIVRDLARKFPSNVSWLGFVSDKQLVKEYLNSDLLVFPSRFESFGLSLAEGQGYGLPGVSFNVRGPDVIMNDPVQGKFAKPFDTDSFSREIVAYHKLWKKDKAAYLSAKKRISRLIIDRFGESRIIPEVEGMLKGQ